MLPFEQHEVPVNTSIKEVGQFLEAQAKIGEPITYKPGHHPLPGLTPAYGRMAEPPALLDLWRTRR